MTKLQINYPAASSGVSEDRNGMIMPPHPTLSRGGRGNEKVSAFLSLMLSPFPRGGTMIAILFFIARVDLAAFRSYL